MIFKYQAYRNLIDDLGKLDFVIEISELAIRDFVQTLKNSGNPESFLKSKCDEHTIYVGLNDLTKISNTVSISNIIQVYQCVSNFFYNFQTEYNDICGTKWIFTQGETKLSQIKKYFKEKFNKHDFIDEHLIDIFNYYHEVRDKFSHPKITDKELKKRFETTIEYKDFLLKEYGMQNSPKKYNEIDFEDFILFTKISKSLCLKISSFCTPNPEHIIQYLKLKRFKRLRGERLSIAISIELQKNFSVKFNPKDNFIKEILEKL